MCDSWRTGCFWFNCGIKKSFDVDTVYWAALHDSSTGVKLLDNEMRAEMESIKQMKIEQLKAYKEECAARLSKRGSDLSRVYHLRLTFLCFFNHQKPK